MSERETRKLAFWRKASFAECALRTFRHTRTRTQTRHVAPARPPPPPMENFARLEDLIEATSRLSKLNPITVERLSFTFRTPYGPMTGVKAEAFASSLERAAFPKLESINLERNFMQPADMELIASALDGSRLPSVKRLDLYDNRIGDAGTQALAAALERGALPKLESLTVSRNEIGAVGAQSLARAFERGTLRSLMHIHLSTNSMGCDGAIAFASALESGALCALMTLDIGNNGIGILESGRSRLPSSAARFRLLSTSNSMETTLETKELRRSQ